jgi:hypothetical protein
MSLDQRQAASELNLPWPKEVREESFLFE